jgi:glutaminyl-tRNA synthetase
MPTISGIRRRGYPAAAMRAFCEEIGVTKQNSVIDVGRLENAVRDNLNKSAPRTMAVVRPLKVIIENWPAGKVDELDFVVNPEDAAAGTIKVPFSGELYIEQDDFMEVPAKKFFRLAPGAEVRLRWAYFIKCTGVDKDASGRITAVRCTYDPATRGGDAPAGPNGEPPRKVKGTLHWVSAAHAVAAEVRLFDRLFKVETPGTASGDYLADLNPASLEVTTALVDPRLTTAPVGTTYQFERLGYFTVDQDSAPGRCVLNRTVTLKDAWAREK